MTNRRRRWLFPVLALAACGVLLASCALGNRHRQVSATEFIELASKPIGSAFDTRFIGTAWGNAYLSVWSASSSLVYGGEDTCSCPLAELPPEITAKIRAGGNPWPK